MDATLRTRLEATLAGVLLRGPLEAMLRQLGPTAGRPVSALRPGEAAQCLRSVALALKVCCGDTQGARLAQRRVEAMLAAASGPPAPRPAGLASAPPAAMAPGVAAEPDRAVAVGCFEDAMQARVAAKQMAERLGFTTTVSVKIATAVSELARNIVFYAGQGTLELCPLVPADARRRGMRVVARDDGPGIANLEEVLSGRYRSTRGLGLGLRGVRQLMDEFAVETGAGRGTVVRACKWLQPP